MSYLQREKRIHEQVFDTLSRPLSRTTESEDVGMFSAKKVKWNHFGKKYVLRISDYEMEYADLFDAFMKKVHEVRPDFEGALAYIDQYGRQTIVTSDKELRDALQQSKNKLKLHTTLPEGAVVSAAEIAGRPVRSQSVPPERSYHSYPPANSRSPSSMESAPATYRHNRVSSPPPPKHRDDMALAKTSMSSAGSYTGGYQVGYPGYPYGTKYATYTTGPYSQSILYGMPPHNGMLWRFLASPFPFGSYQRTFVGPNKYHNFGAWGGSKYYGGSSWGPVW